MSDEVLFRISAPAIAYNVGLIRISTRRALCDLALNEGVIDDIMLAVGEACNNAVLHASEVENQTLDVCCSYTTKPRPTVIVEIKNIGTSLVDNLSDSLFAMPSAELMGEHGRGLPLIRSLMDNVKVYAEGEWTVVRLEKYV